MAQRVRLRIDRAGVLSGWRTTLCTLRARFQHRIIFTQHRAIVFRADRVRMKGAETDLLPSCPVRLGRPSPWLPALSQNKKKDAAECGTALRCEGNPPIVRLPVTTVNRAYHHRSGNERDDGDGEAVIEEANH